MDAYLIAEAHRAEKDVCTCGRPLPCIAAQRAAEIMDETMVAARLAEQWTRAAEAAVEEQRAISRAITQDLPILVDLPEPAPAPVGARFYRERKPPRHRS
ncbi:hypothetical protein [Cryptosporangium sp. NPDC048952]|uniref:hypothetical protein n=1 Tax=Cryptosporangium sp. NPDC048952 TaxID=3363961 RepID=UPI00371744C8